jgi:hypothetical protein
MPVFNPLAPELNFQCNLQNPRYKLQDAKSRKTLSPPPPLPHYPKKISKQKQNLKTLTGLYKNDHNWPMHMLDH